MYVSGDNRSGDAGALISGRGVLRDPSKQGAAKTAMSLARLSNADALDNMSSVALAFAYSYSSAAAYAIADKHGRKALLRLLTRLQQREDQGPRAQAGRPRRAASTLQSRSRRSRREIDAYAAVALEF